MLRLFPNLNSADKIHNTTTLPTHSCLFIPCCPFSLHRASQESLILVLFCFPFTQMLQIKLRGLGVYSSHLRVHCQGLRVHCHDLADWWGHVLAVPCVAKAWPSRVATRPTIRYSYGSNLLVFLRDREAPLPCDRSSLLERRIRGARSLRQREQPTPTSITHGGAEMAAVAAGHA